MPHCSFPRVPLAPALLALMLTVLSCSNDPADQAVAPAATNAPAVALSTTAAAAASAALTATPTAMPIATQAATPPSATAPATASTRLLLAVRDPEGTAIVAVDPAEAAAPAARRRLLHIPHHPDWGVRAALSPDGRSLAVTVMPRTGANPDRDATLQLVSLVGDAPRTTRVSGVDLRTTPVWLSNDGVVVQRVGPNGAGRLVRVALDGAERVLLDAQPGTRILPAAADGAGGLWVAEYLDSGSRLRLLDGAGQTGRTVPLQGTAARAFALSPKRDALAYLSLRPGSGGNRYQATVAPLSGSATAPAPTAPAGEHTGVAWRPDGTLVTSSAGPESAAIQGWSATPAAAPGFDAAVAVSPDGRWLALRHFEGGTPAEPGRESLVLVGPDGRRIPLDGSTLPEVIGWLQP